MRRAERRRQEVARLRRYSRRRASGEIWGNENVCRQICQEEVCGDVLRFPAEKLTQKTQEYTVYSMSESPSLAVVNFI